MFDVAVYAKTARGRAEIALHRGHLPARLRQALILIDGRTPFGVLSETLERFGDPREIVRRLGELGLVESDHDLPPMPVFGAMHRDEPSTQMGA
ncbi:MAG: hypothetical protein REI09_13175 [Candidatus Dactylopiibacterium sp.]|nr:hypothetical protein [Candidatus Dactylopiibacterium sp.]